jgi:redox-sensitive bicupin YhaK (pirin superfamily)
MRIVPAQQFTEGGGFVVHRPFPVTGLSYVDPFLLIDEMGPAEYGPGEAIGAPDHPHRGFETVTYMIEGAMEHEDSHGHRGAIRSGDVQWMTAGAGVIHSEMPAREIMQSGGRMHGFQIWVNLPRDKKMTQPRYQEYSGEQLPLVTGDGRWVRVIAGEFDGRRSPIQTTVPTTLLHVKLDPGRKSIVRIASGSNAIVHAIDGSGTVHDSKVKKHDVAILEGARAELKLIAGSEPLEALVLAGVPLGEPVARYGPFVMNTQEELVTAFEDFQRGRFGQIAQLQAAAEVFDLDDKR